MAKRKTVTKKFLRDSFVNYVLEFSQHPQTVYTFAKEHNFDEQIFYRYYGSFQAIEKDVFTQLFHTTEIILTKSEEYAAYEPRTKLLSFYFTFFENLTANRSYVLQALTKEKNKLRKVETLSELRKQFIAYIDKLQIEKIDLQNENLNKIQNRTVGESAWVQMLLILKFWIEDESPNFEKTDILIEKSVNTTFDLLDVAPLKSVIDLGKFVWKERINLNI